MPKKFNPKAEYVLKPDAVNFPFLTGREIYTELSYTGLNKSPIVKLQAFILAGLVETGNPPWPVPEMSERLLVDGTVVWYEPEGFIYDIYDATRNRILARIRDEDGKIIHDKRRRFERVGEKWSITDEDYKDGKWVVHRNYGDIPDDPTIILVHPNNLGLLFPVQNIYHRLEEIQKILRAESTGAKRKSIISGFAGDVKQLDEAMRSDRSVINIPGNVTVTHPAATAIVTQLLEEKNDLLIQYNENTMNYISGEGSEMSGVSRRLMMAPMLQFVKGMRKQLREIYERYVVTLEFDKVQVQTIDERQAQYNMLKLMRDDQVITREEFKERAIELA